MNCTHNSCFVVLEGEGGGTYTLWIVHIIRALWCWRGGGGSKRIWVLTSPRAPLAIRDNKTAWYRVGYTITSVCPQPTALCGMTTARFALLIMRPGAMNVKKTSLCPMTAPSVRVSDQRTLMFDIMMSWHRGAFRLAVPFWRESCSHWLIPLTMDK